jgi:UDP-glucose 4-epimerase
MLVLVTGGAGYIGSHTVRLLRERGYDVLVLDSMEFGHQEAIGDTPLVRGNIADSALLDRLFAEHPIAAVIHFAAYKAAGESMEQPGRYFQNNVCGTLALLEAMTRAGVGRFIFSSSCSVYGTPDVLPVSEANPLHPESPYAESKRMVEQMLHWFDVVHKLRFVSLRYFNAAGAALDGSIGEDPTFTLNLIPLVMKAALGKIPAVQVFGTDYPTPDGTGIRDYIHVSDLIGAHALALAHLRSGGDSSIFNCGYGHGFSVRQVAQAVERAAGVRLTVKELPRRAGDPPAIVSNPAKLKAALGWKPQHDSLDEIVTSALAWESRLNSV